MKMAIRVERILGSVTSGLPFGTQPMHLEQEEKGKMPKSENDALVSIQASTSIPDITSSVLQTSISMIPKEREHNPNHFLLVVVMV